MDGWLLTAFFGLAVAQIALYQIPSKQALHGFWFLGFFYFFLFAFAQGVALFSRLFSLPFYEFPLFFLAVFVLFRRTGKPFPQFGKQVRLAPDFYLFSAIWMGVIWLSFILTVVGAVHEPPLHGRWQEIYVQSFFWSFFPALVLPVLAGIRDRLALLDPPKAFEGLPVFLIASAIFLLAILFFLSFINSSSGR